MKDAGIHPNLRIDLFTPEEKSVIRTCSAEWYVTLAGKLGSGGGQISPESHKFILLKPTEHIKNAFNLTREVVCVLSPFVETDARTLAAISEAQSRFGHTRVDRICSLLISKDENIVQNLPKLVRNDIEAQIIVPFTYSELQQPKADPFFLRQRLRNYFYTRDLFDFGSALTKGLFFFGRSDLVQQIVNRHQAGQISALFGLRKSGKTSVINAVHRTLKAQTYPSVYIDCENPAFHQNRWDKALWYVLRETRNACADAQLFIPLAQEFVGAKAADFFEKHLINLYKRAGNNPILITFDEIEKVTPAVSPSPHWRDDKDFVYFWQTLRALFQKVPDLFTYWIVGTNPSCNETATICGVETPLFCQLPKTYIPRFNVQQTREMVRRLGRLMGLAFDEGVYGLLNEDYGGHPFIIRQVCSVIHTLADQNRPVHVHKTLYDKAKERFRTQGSNYFPMIFDVLQKYYPDEYVMLQYLAVDDKKSFAEFSAEQGLTEHLLSYGILELQDGTYVFRVDALKEFIAERSKYLHQHLTSDGVRQEIIERQERLEIRLRQLCRNLLQAFYGASAAKENVLEIFGHPRTTKLAALE